MFRVEVECEGVWMQVFLDEAPATDDPKYPHLGTTVDGKRVIETQDGVTLNNDLVKVHTPNADPTSITPPPFARVGQSPTNHREYEVFRSEAALRAQNYKPMSGAPVQSKTWADYLAGRVSG